MIMDAINVWGPSGDKVSSYGRLALKLADGLHDFGKHVNLISVDGSGDDYGPIIPAIGGFKLGYPTNFKHFGKMSEVGTQIGMTMFESTQLPKDWDLHLNKCDAVILPSNWLFDVFRKCGVTVPIYIVPLGISEMYAFQQREFSGQLKFLVITDNGLRKGWSTAFGAFMKAFGDDENYQLTIKSLKGQFKHKFQHPNVTVIEEDFSEEELLQLYYDHQFMISPTRGEGFGFLPREFARTGGISITTEWSGTAQDLECWGLPISYSFESAWKNYPNLKGLGQWALPNLQDLTTTLKSIPYFLKELSALSVQYSDFVKYNYRWDKFCRECLAIYESHSK